MSRMWTCWDRSLPHRKRKASSFTYDTKDTLLKYNNNIIIHLSSPNIDHIAILLLLYLLLLRIIIIILETNMSIYSKDML